ncbi:ATP-binding protein [Streptomyces sp. CBMA29]|uniref:ATP-binding protein n=1 Tax=Streptomyces sp. CBMA29 TaxID=1896314 RepID=UPI001661C4F4|nr:ATP-binding protein [Streptomyces sp. CBMA29]
MNFPPPEGPAPAGERDSVIVKSWPHGPRSVGAARRLLAGCLGEWGLGHLAEAAELVVSELVTNSVRHARRPSGHLIRTRFERLRDGVRIEVHDASGEKPERREAASDAEPPGPRVGSPSPRLSVADRQATRSVPVRWDRAGPRLWPTR